MLKAKKPLSLNAALARAEDLCARSEHCSGEIREKLYKWGIEADDRDKIIASLISRRYIDDARFAEIFARNKMEFSGWGRRKIAAALAQKRIDRHTIALALEQLDQERYEQRLRDIIVSKRRATPDADTYEGRTRIFRFAASRGFEPELIAQCLRNS